MKSFLGLIPISAKVRRRQNRMTLLCIVIAVFLVTTIFSMVQSLLNMETERLIRSNGYWHIALSGISEDIADQVNQRSDVKSVSQWAVINEDGEENYFLGSHKAVLYSADEAWFTDIWDCLEEGAYPQNDTEVILSTNAKSILQADIGDRVTLDTPSGNMEYVISGFGSHDEEFNVLSDAITVYMTETALSNLCGQNGAELSLQYYVRFSSDTGITRRISELKSDYGLTDDMIRENTGLLAVTGYSSNEIAQTFYPIAAVLFVLILLAGVFMISSSMNSNVAQRTQFFGMMRCIGMSKRQVIQYVRLEALNWCVTAVPAGLILGVAASWGLCFWLRYGIQGEFTEIALFPVSFIGIALWIAVGVLTVFVAAYSPAKRAARVSPATAVSGNSENTDKVHRAKYIGLLKVDAALGINHAVSAKKNLILMTGSFALSIIIFFGFSAGLDFVKSILPSTRSWQPDFAITCSDETNSVSKSLADEIIKIDGVSHVFGNMAAIGVPAVSDKEIDEVTIVSYDDYLFDCAGDSKVSGDFSKVSGNCRYVLAIYNTLNPLETGDIINVGGTELEVAGIVSDALFEDDITLICTEETFQQLIGPSEYGLLCVQMTSSADKDSVAAAIRALISDDYSLSDYYENNQVSNAEFWGFRLVVYVFLAIIILMAALNIINSTSMSVSARTKQYGAMRAVGADSRQLTKMIAAEVFTYAAVGCVVGCLAGMFLHRKIYEAFITAYYGKPWHVPAAVTAVILLAVFASAAAAVYIPAKRICSTPITGTINEL